MTYGQHGGLGGGDDIASVAPGRPRRLWLYNVPETETTSCPNIRDLAAQRVWRHISRILPGADMAPPSIRRSEGSK